MNNIVEIPLYKLVHHPQNPRKELGDLTELTESIKTSGIMQNLTVVEQDTGYCMCYVVVIGNRRMEAAKLAGLETVPCVVVKMSLQEQLSTMMVENMQRSDLTVFEQAQGFQLMMDMGDTVDTIAEKTGFSRSTVRRRVKLMELDQKELKRVSERQISMADLDELNKLSDVKARNRLLPALGTGSFQYELNREMEREKNARRLDILAALMKKKKIPPYVKGSNKTYAGPFHVRSDAPAKVEEEFEKQFGKFSGLCYDKAANYIYIYRDWTENETLSEQKTAEQQKRADYRRDIIKRVNHDMWLARLTFIRNYKEQDAREHFGEIAKVIAGRTAQSDYHIHTRVDLRLIMQIDDEADDETVDDKVAMAAASTPARLMLWTAYDLMDDTFDEDGYISGTWDGNPGYSVQNGEELDKIYDFLIALGYELSTEEEDIRDGVSDYCFPSSDVYRMEENKPIPIEAIADDVRMYNKLRRAGITDSDKLLKAAENGSLFGIAGTKYTWLKDKAMEKGIALPDMPGEEADQSDEE